MSEFEMTHAPAEHAAEYERVVKEGAALLAGAHPDVALNAVVCLLAHRLVVARHRRPYEEIMSAIVPALRSHLRVLGVHEDAVCLKRKASGEAG